MQKTVGKIGKVLLILGLLFSLISIWQTLAFTFDKDFQAPALADGPTHTNYHAFRGGMLALGVVLGVFYLAFMKKQNRKVWNVIMLCVLFYYAGWWLPSLWGLVTPHAAALMVHIFSTSLVVGGLLMIKPPRENV